MSKRPSEPIWTRDEPGTRRPRHTREQIAAAALAVADSEGLEAVSMRRIASELGAGTMTLYYYVRTKAELLDLMDDAIMGEVLVPDDELSTNWRAALTQIATRSRDAFGRHPWAFEGLRGARGGPNGMKHFEQSLASVSSLDLGLEQKLEIVLIVDDYVFGYVLRSAAPGGELSDPEARQAACEYLARLVATGDYPHTSAMFAGYDIDAALDRMIAAFRDKERFAKGLERLMDGLEADLRSRGVLPGGAHG